MDPETTASELSLEESIQLLLKKVPVPVRDFVLNELGTKTEELMTRYQLHIDQGGLLERELLLMLLGQEQPAEFVAALQTGGIVPQTVQSIASDVNTEIFMKLHAAESASAGSTNPSTPASANPLPGAPSAWSLTPSLVPTPTARPTPAPPVVPVPAYGTAAPVSPLAQPVAAVQNTPSVSQFAPAPLYPTNPAAINPPTHPSTPPTPHMSTPAVRPPRTMAHDMADLGGNPRALPTYPTPAPRIAPIQASSIPVPTPASTPIPETPRAPVTPMRAQPATPQLLQTERRFMPYLKNTGLIHTANFLSSARAQVVLHTFRYCYTKVNGIPSSPVH